MDQTRFVILLLSDSVDCTIRQELREKLLDVIDTRVYALAEYYDLSAKVKSKNSYSISTA